MSFFFFFFFAKMETCMKYPISVQSFEYLRENEYLYVDKTDMVYDLAQKHVCFLCRPRRFGKSLLLSTLEAYFKGKKDLFKNLKIEQLEHDWTQYPVFKLDFNGLNFSDPESLPHRLDDAVSDWEKEYNIVTDKKNIGDRFANVLQRAYAQTGQRCVVLIDEYDKPLLDILGEHQEEINQEILKGFYSVFKLADDCLRFVILTGVTKFSQVSVFSGFNQPYDISMSSDYEAICGITEHELHTVLESSVEELADKLNATMEQMYGALKALYDGYHFSAKMTDIYNPYSLFYAFSEGNLRDYWYSTGTPEYLAKLLENANVDMPSLLSKNYSPEYFIDYRANTEDPLAMLYQSGYLTIKDVFQQEDFSRLYKLDFPNIEVSRGFLTLLGNRYFAAKEDFGGLARDMFVCLRDNDMDRLHAILKQYLSTVDYEMRKDKEYHFQYTLYLIFSLIATFYVSVERHTSQGRVDLIVESRDHIYIFEFKLDGTAKAALQQIEKNKYAVPYLTDPRPIHKIGVSFGRKSGTIDEWKVM